MTCNMNLQSKLHTHTDICHISTILSKPFKELKMHKDYLLSSSDVLGARNRLRFLPCSVLLRTFRQSKKLSTISQSLAVAVASGGPNDLSTAATEALRTCAARFTRITE